MKTVLRKCSQCGEKFEASVREVRRGNGKLCSRRCTWESNKGKRSKRTPNTVCAYCDKAIYKPPSRIKASKTGVFFCSRRHKDLGQRLENGITEIHPPHYGTSKKVDYRSLVTISKCERCAWDAVPAVLQVHHKDEDRSNNNIDNLEVLCPTCHMVQHYHNGTGLWGTSKGL